MRPPRETSTNRPIKTSRFQLCLVIAISAFAAGSLRADGLAVSADGTTWLSGAGAYGTGWGEVGRGIVIKQGATLYVKYYCTRGDAQSLLYAAHGQEWGSWHAIGPVLRGDPGENAALPVILKFEEVGTPGSTARRVDGPGVWTGLQSPGAFDLALHQDARWTLPPITILAVEDRRSWWASLALRRPFRAGEEKDPGVPVSDGGATVLLLALAVVGIALLYRIRYQRRRPATPTEKTPK